MSEFAVSVERIRAIEPIPEADKIELAVIGEYRSVVAKGAFKPGDLAVYLPEGSVLPDWLIERLNLVGKLSGGQKNRIKAIRLRGCLSQGIVYPAHDTILEAGTLSSVTPAVVWSDGVARSVEEGDDVAEFLGIKKYDPTEAMDANQRRRMHGECVYIPGKTVKYDFENWKKYPWVFNEGDEVVITEKLHGTMCCFAYYPGLNHPELPDDTFVYSKGLGASGQVFKWNEANAENLYLKAFRSLTNETNLAATVTERLAEALYDLGLAPPETPLFLFGEVFGKGVQDLGYGYDTPVFRAFDLWVGTPEGGRFIDAVEKFDLFKAAGVEAVPVLYHGPFSREVMMLHTDGLTSYGGVNIREGVVVTSAREEWINRYGRKIQKNVSGDYLTRKGNTTEFN
jgi:RNA ligase (TIGR02306 family)